jgi:hypothetical protein
MHPMNNDNKKKEMHQSSQTQGLSTSCNSKGETDTYLDNKIVDRYFFFTQGILQRIQFPSQPGLK